ALYEISNAIYPAAYLTVGHCARLGHVLGIHSNTAPQKLVSPRRSPYDVASTTPETDVPQRLAPSWRSGAGPGGPLLCWTGKSSTMHPFHACHLHRDRYVNLGGTNRPFACKDALPETHLPIDDRSWDQGVSHPCESPIATADLYQDLALVQPLAVSTSTTIPAPPFARTCQATHLLSKVLTHLDDTTTEPDFRYQEALQIDRTLRAFCSTLLTDAEDLAEKTSDPGSYLHFGAALGLGYSAILSLYGTYSCAEQQDARQLGNPSLLEMQKTAMANLMGVCGEVSRLARRVSAAAELGGMLSMSPLLCNCFYEAGANYLWRIRETGDQGLRRDFFEIEGALGIMGTRWQCARKSFVHPFALAVAGTKSAQGSTSGSSRHISLRKGSFLSSRLSQGA
ncbi:fungal specific transcription factor domain-containing protein, partial [Candidatus Bathyarchaeota archaeon]|nr:fungal specific transcription factor domain-containing protein [Candidatus Bathyarchaeota archaeon]